MSRSGKVIEYGDSEVRNERHVPASDNPSYIMIEPVYFPRGLLSLNIQDLVVLSPCIKAV